MQNTQCPLCASSTYTINSKFNSVDTDYKVVDCSSCGHIYSYIEKEVDTRALYEDEVYSVVENRGSSFDKFMNFEYKNILKKAESILKKKGKLLDFGCGKGKFPWLAKTMGWTVKGVETSLPRANYAREVYQLDIISSYYTGGKIDEKGFDIISLFHVAEHLPQPKELLKELLENNLTDKGIFIIEVPNIKSWQAKWAKNNWMHLDLPRHLSHFNNKLVEELCYHVGAQPIKVSFFSFHLGVLGMTHTLMRFTGYKNNLIYDLKNKRGAFLMMRIVLILPFAFLLELISTSFKAGGIIRVYAKKN